MSLRRRWLSVGLGAVLTLAFIAALDFAGFLFIVLPLVPVPPPIPPPLYTDSCDPGGTFARLTLADPATRIGVPWAGVTRATLDDSHSTFIEPSNCSSTTVEIDYRSFDLHATFMQLCSEVAKRGWTADTSSGNSSNSAYAGGAIAETCYFTKTIAGHEAVLSVEVFVKSVDGPLVALFIEGPENLAAHFVTPPLA